MKPRPALGVLVSPPRLLLTGLHPAPPPSPASTSRLPSSCSVPCADVPAGTSTLRSPSFAHSSSRRSACAAGRRRPVRPISPNAAVARAHGHAPRGRGDRERDREVGARLVDAHAAGDVDEDVGRAERDAARDARARRRSSRAACGSTPVPTRRGIARSVGATSAWISSRIGRVPSSAQATAAPTSPATLRPKSSDGSGTPTRPAPVISKTPSSFVEPKRFFAARRMRCAW